MLPNYEQYPLLETKVAALEKQLIDIQAESTKLREQRDDYEKRWVTLRDREVIPKDQHDKILKQMRQDSKEERRKLEDKLNENAQTVKDLINAKKRN